MSNYRDYVSDFPKRCEDLLTRFIHPAQKLNREVTLMLSVATAGFVIPFERLRSGTSHPSRDRDKHIEAAVKLDAILETPFLSSQFWNEPVGSWGFAKQVEDTTQEPDLWPELQDCKAMTDKKAAKTVIEHLRNALAHGNIFTQGNPIERIIFLSRVCEGSDKYKMLTVSPDDFGAFLEKWFSVLASVNLPSGLVEDLTQTRIDFLSVAFKS